MGLDCYKLVSHSSDLLHYQCVRCCIISNLLTLNESYFRLLEVWRGRSLRQGRRQVQVWRGGRLQRHWWRWGQMGRCWPFLWRRPWHGQWRRCCLLCWQRWSWSCWQLLERPGPRFLQLPCGGNFQNCCFIFAEMLWRTILTEFFYFIMIHHTNKIK